MIAMPECPPSPAIASSPGQVRVTRGANAPVTQVPACGDSEPWPTELDARSPQPPIASVAILAALTAMPAGRAQYVRTSRKPVNLLVDFEARGITGSTHQLPDGSWRTLLRRRVDSAGAETAPAGAGSAARQPVHAG